MTDASKYVVPEYFLRPYPRWSHSWEGEIFLTDIHPDVGHTLVHYLYIGAYETLRCSSSEGCRREIEFRRAVYVYHAARAYGISGLEQCAKEYMRRFDDAATLFDILGVGREVFSKLPGDETWFQRFIIEKMLSASKADEESFKTNLIRYRIGHDDCFDPLLLRIILSIFPARCDACLKAGVDDGVRDGGSLVASSGSLQVAHEDNMKPQEGLSEGTIVEMEYAQTPSDEPVAEGTTESAPIEALNHEEPVRKNCRNGIFRW